MLISKNYLKRFLIIKNSYRSNDSILKTSSSEQSGTKYKTPIPAKKPYLTSGKNSVC